MAYHSARHPGRLTGCTAHKRPTGLHKKKRSHVHLCRQFIDLGRLRRRLFVPQKNQPFFLSSIRTATPRITIEDYKPAIRCKADKTESKLHLSETLRCETCQRSFRQSYESLIAELHNTIISVTSDTRYQKEIV